MSKKCTRCRRVLDLDGFHRSRASKDGFYSICKDCRAGRSIIASVPDGFRQCRVCDVVKRDREFYPCTTATRLTCIECCEAKWSKSYKRKTHRIGNGKLTLFGFLSSTEQTMLRRNNPKVRGRVREADRRYKTSDRGKQRRAEWVSQNLDTMRGYCQTRVARVRGLPADFSVDDWLATLSAFGERCGYCGVSGIQLARDHWVPLTRGGGYIMGNIVPACKSCNSSKGNKTPEEFCSREVYLRVSKTLAALCAEVK